MTQFPLISIIVPVYNTEYYLKKSISSILHQTYKNIEVIVVDDGSTDNSYNICCEFMKIDQRIKLYKTENHGQGAARNFALKKSSGDYIGFVDSDDYIDYDMFEYLYNQIVKYDADISICGLYAVKNNHIQHSCDNKIIVYDKLEAMHNILQDEIIHSYSVDKLYSKNLFRDFSYPEGRSYEDTASIYKLFHNANRIVFANMPKYYYVYRENSTCNDKQPIKTYHNFLAFRDRYIFSSQFYHQSIDICLGKAAALALGTYGLYLGAKDLNEKYFYSDVKYFMTDHIKEILQCKSLDLFRKIAILIVIYNPPIYSMLIKTIKIINYKSK